MILTRSLRFLYSALFYVALPFLFLRLLWRSRLNPAYRQNLLERLGWSSLSFKKSIWVHAVSVGESIAAIPLIQKLHLLYPTLPIVVTTTTPTGAARIDAALGGTVARVYLPYDLRSAVNRFLKRCNPVLAIVMESELWPNLISCCQRRKLPLVIANGRLSEGSVPSYRFFSLLTRPMFSALSLLMAQTKADAERYLTLGVKAASVAVTGNIKFDLELPATLLHSASQLRTQLGQQRLIWVAASTHRGEEEVVLQAHQAILKNYPEALLILVPRHPERFTEVADLCRRQGFQFVRRSGGEQCSAETTIYLADTMGELLLFYAAADLAFVGGSIAQIGGHNLLEPAALSKPVIAGPQLFKFTEIATLLRQEDALVTIEDATSLAHAIERFFFDPVLRKQAGENAQQVLVANRGALAKHLDLITGLLGSPESIQCL